MTPARSSAVVLLSGGLDSATVAAYLSREGFDVRALTVDYGQRHRAEVEAARRIAATLGVVEHQVLGLDLRAFGGSALTDEIEVPKAEDPLAPVPADVPVTYVPARNAILLSLALAFAEARGAKIVGIGVNALDYSGYPDCRPEFVRAFQQVADLGTKAGASGRDIRIQAPLQDMSKVAILRLARELNVPVGLTLSCYDPGAEGEPCGHCDACRLRARAEQEAGAG